ncbi:MAG: TIGR03086 family metal-binding protein, partial [Ornithinimicrobium sp.]
MTDIRDHLESTMATTEGILRGVSTDDWTTASVCDDWTVRQLVEHLVGSCALTASVLSAQESPTRPEYGDVPDEELPARYAEAGRVVVDALSDPAVLTQTVTVGFGPVPGAVAARLCLVETIVHGWDVARSTGQDVDFSEDAAAEALQFSQGMMSQLPPDRSPFDPSQPVDDDSPTVDRLVALLGR